MKRFISLFIVLVTYTSCNFNNDTRDTYYTDHGDWDMVRFPLIKPYEALRLNGHPGWFVQITPNDIGYFTASGAQKINVINRNTLLIYCKDTLLEGVEVKQAWHVLIPDKKIQKSFTSQFAYQDYLHLLGIKHIPQLYDMDIPLNYFAKNDTIDWQKLRNKD